jgi:riboflavin synthase
VFSGIVERVGTVERAERADAGFRLRIHHEFLAEPAAGESVAVNGVCLTVERSVDGVFEAVAVDETLRKTTLGRLESGGRVNLERALRVGDPLGGHWVQGHVDGVGAVRSVSAAAADSLVGFEIPEPLRRFVAAKGSIAVDGVSLTVAGWADPIATVALVPYTLSHTVASGYRPGTSVNLEVDLIARYLERLLEERGVLNEAADHGPRAGRNR